MIQIHDTALRKLIVLMRHEYRDDNDILYWYVLVCTYWLAGRTIIVLRFRQICTRSCLSLHVFLVTWSKSNYTALDLMLLVVVNIYYIFSESFIINNNTFIVQSCLVPYHPGEFWKFSGSTTHPFVCWSLYSTPNTVYCIF